MATPRINVEISEELSARLTNVLSWGLRKRVFTIIAEDLCTILEGPDAAGYLAALLSRDMKAMRLYEKDGLNKNTGVNNVNDR